MPPTDMTLSGLVGGLVKYSIKDLLIARFYGDGCLADCGIAPCSQTSPDFERAESLLKISPPIPSLVIVLAPSGPGLPE
jgi:hypothetical protein